MNVLIVEDNLLVQALHERTMRKWKYNAARNLRGGLYRKSVFFL